VVPEIIEGSLMLASHALALAGVPVRRVLHRVRQVRRTVARVMTLLKQKTATKAA
jgi:hypothetical protein